jgi:hypothetical protein
VDGVPRADGNAFRPAVLPGGRVGEVMGDGPHANAFLADARNPVSVLARVLKPALKSGSPRK